MASSRMIALLGLLAVAGYQNRERLGEFIGRVTGQTKTKDSSAVVAPPLGEGTGLTGTGGFFGDLFGSGTGGSNIAGCLWDLVDRLTGNGQGDAARSWVETGPNRELGTAQIEEALGADAIDELTRATGLSREELLARLKSVLPAAVDRMTPEGRLPTETEIANWARVGSGTG